MTWVDLRQGLTDDGLARLVWGITGTKGERAKEVATPARGIRERPGRFNRWSWGALALLGVLLTLTAWLWPRSPEPLPLPVRPPTYSVRVQVLNPQGLPVAGATIRVSTSNELQGTPDGWCVVEISAAKVPVDGLITLWAEHPDWGGNRKDLRLGTDQNVRAEIRLKEPESWLRGMVVDESGRGLKGVRVSRQDGVPGNAATDSEGRFALKLPDPPEKRIRVRAEQDGLTPAETYCLAGHDTCSILLEKP